jgi:hypothetical protein
MRKKKEGKRKETKPPLTPPIWGGHGCEGIFSY